MIKKDSQEFDILGLPLNKALEIIKNKSKDVSYDVSYIETRTNKNDFVIDDTSGDPDAVNFRVVKAEEKDNKITLTIVRNQL